MPFRFHACWLFSLVIASSCIQAAQTNVTILVPGFTVRELPVRISNINSLRFSPKGELTALGYDGRVHILRDSDGDGLEDQDNLFWANPGITVPVGMAWAKDGLYVSSHGKVSLLRDTDGDGVADVEDVVASDWPPTDVGSGGVDATAVTLDKDDNLYFGLLTSDYSNAYRVKDGVSHYDINSRRGTIQKWVRATKRLETIATGIRVPYTLAFNRAGDLFVTDQEGETWCPGGNPRDELDQIIRGHNYGFPPRHPVFLPSLVSEPPVVAFSPQHQSSCGFVFNEPSARQKLFGPADWEGDAFVAGESRGKIWRVRLSKVGERYVGKDTLFARLNMLTTDVAISPKGDLYVCCHSGKPDWGTGPNGEGKLFKISYTQPDAPRPVALWAVGPFEMRVAFNKPVSEEIAKNSERMQIDFGEFVEAADRLEVLKPPYKVVEQQEGTPRGKLRVVGAKLSDDRRTLALTTDPHPQNVGYAISIPFPDKSANTANAIDLAYSLSGLEATLLKKDDLKNLIWSGWLPHADIAVSKHFLSGSAEHERFLAGLRPGTVLRLHSVLSLPGAAKLFAEANGPVKIETAYSSATAAGPGGSGLIHAEISVRPDGSPQDFNIEFWVDTTEPVLRISYSSDIDPTIRPLPFSAFTLPWAPARVALPSLQEEQTEIVGGDFERGRSLFTSERLKCSSCHRLRGEGSLVGPDLSNLVHRDAASVLHDIKEPSASINPDYVAYNVTMVDDESLTGFVRSQNERELRIISADGHERIVPRSQIIRLQVSTVSLMPAGLVETLKEEEIRDLLTFLLNEPPVRQQTEFASLIRSKSTPQAARRDLKIVLVASKQDHGPAQHDYPDWQKKWPALLEENPGVRVETAWEWPSVDQFETAQVLVFYFWNHDWNPVRYEQLDKYFARGGGVVILHSATIADSEPEKLAERIGLASQPGSTKYRHTPFVLKFSNTEPGSITEGFTQLNLLDEPYWPMSGNPNRVNILASANVDGESRPLIWTYTPGKGRVFASIPCHYTWTWSDPVFRVLLFRGIAWAAGEDASRFDPPSSKTFRQ